VFLNPYARLGRLEVELINVLSKVTGMSTQLDALTAQVAASNSVAASAITLLNGLSAQLAAAIAAQPQDDGAALAALSLSLSTETTSLAAAVSANTPAAAPAATTGAGT
jgi:hypothetical protein